MSSPAGSSEIERDSLEVAKTKVEPRAEYQTGSQKKLKGNYVRKRPRVHFSAASATVRGTHNTLAATPIYPLPGVSPSSGISRYGGDRTALVQPDSFRILRKSCTISDSSHFDADCDGSACCGMLLRDPEFEEAQRIGQAAAGIFSTIQGALAKY